ncbi:alpha/beta fold hydrolase [Cyclobacterium xiamenense]|uniref:alpha/beta fold hydrolase n=1 Tax=Cyclobacterium xiamenense TaxID=1297121 RepID=UPI0035D09B8E
MKVLLKICKGILKSIGLLVAIIIFAGLIFRLFAPKPQPPGELMDIGGFSLHINSIGSKSNKPTLVIESGAGAPTEYYYWLGEGLKDSMQVVRYDRAGIGYSDVSDTPRDPETIARELHNLLEKAGISPPYIMAGHSYGGHYIRVFTELYPDDVVGLVFLDAPHPNESERLNMPPEPKFLNTLYYIGAVSGDLGILGMFDRILGPILWAPGLPEEVTERYHDYTLSGKYLWGYLKEEKWYPGLVEISGTISDFGSVPIRVFAGTNLNEKALLDMGLNPEEIKTERRRMQEEVASLSTNGKAFFLEGGHITIFSQKENADIICNEILKLSGEVKME